MANQDKEFFSDWHRERYLEDVEREIAGWKRRIAELEALDLPGDERVLKQTKGALSAAQAELRRLRPPKAAAKK